MITDILPQSAVDIDKTRVSLVDNVRQFNLEQQVFLQENTGNVREFTASLTGLQHQEFMYLISSKQRDYQEQTSYSYVSMCRLFSPWRADDEATRDPNVPS